MATEAKATEDRIVRVDPKTLLVGPNIRKEIKLPPEFLASIKEHGVKIPIVAHETLDGLEVVDGQMRTLAAVDAGLTEVPVFVRPAVDGGERTVDQLVVNRERTGLSRADEVAAVKQLALDFKMPAAQIVKKLGIAKKDVDHATKIAGNDVATRALANESVDLELAARIADAELTGDEVKQVLGSYNPHHGLQQVLNERATTKMIADLTAELKAEGVKIVAKPSSGDYYSSGTKNKHRYLDELRDKGTKKAITKDSHKDCPGAGAFIGQRGYGGGNPSKFYVCTDPAKHGHVIAGASAKDNAEPASEEEKAKRRQVIDRNKLWLGITEVRRTWIRDLLARTAMPAGWELLVALVDCEEISPAPREWFQFSELAHEFLQVEKVGYQQGAIRSLLSNPKRASAVLVGISIARHERHLTPKDGWKLVDARYLSTLAGWGYGLSEVEAEIVEAAKTPAAAA